MYTANNQISRRCGATEPFAMDPEDRLIVEAKSDQLHHGELDRQHDKPVETVHGEDREAEGWHRVLSEKLLIYFLGKAKRSPPRRRFKTQGTPGGTTRVQPLVCAVSGSGS
jgi:hypothetical protein